MSSSDVKALADTTIRAFSFVQFFIDTVQFQNDVLQRRVLYQNSRLAEKPVFDADNLPLYDIQLGAVAFLFCRDAQIAQDDVQNGFGMRDVKPLASRYDGLCVGRYVIQTHFYFLDAQQQVPRGERPHRRHYIRV